MEAFPILLATDVGTVVRANSTALKRFGSCVGRHCGDVVGLRSADGTTLCTDKCTRELASQGIGIHESRGTVKGIPARVICTSFGQGVVVMIHEEAGIERLKARLTERELEVVTLSARGRTMKEIAQRLGLRVTTVRTHLDHAKEKLGAQNVKDLVARAMDLGLSAAS